MLKRRTILLLAVVMTLGAAFAVPSVSRARGVEVCAIVWLVEQQCERQEIRAAVRHDAEVAAVPIHFHYHAPQVQAFEWPACYQRPPGNSSLI